MSRAVRLQLNVALCGVTADTAEDKGDDDCRENRGRFPREYWPGYGAGGLHLIASLDNPDLSRDCSHAFVPIYVTSRRFRCIHLARPAFHALPETKFGPTRVVRAVGSEVADRLPSVALANEGVSLPFDASLRPLLVPAYKLACVMLQDSGAAADAVQEAASKAGRKFAPLRPGSDMRPWFFGIVANE